MTPFGVKWYLAPPIVRHPLSITPLSAKWYFLPPIVFQPVARVA